MTRLWMSGAAAVMAVSIAGVHAQTTGSQDPQTPQPQTQQQMTTQAEGTTTLRGCVYKEEDVPGRAPNVAERAGVLEDYILVTTDANATAGTSGTTGTTGTTPPTTTTPETAGTAGTVSSAKAFKLEHAPDTQLRSLVGKMVEVTGKVDAERSDTKAAGTTGAPARDRVPGNPDQIELPEFEVTSIREVEGTCPAKPNLPDRR
ncbi:MAG TPA: hypothetical protein VM364_13520 [Vicinamibacterales bacterium]|nr:hypothetical protein [Vicinamibacterales bacterium]